MRPLRICLLSPFSWPEVTRGGERYLHDLAWYLAGQGHVVEVLSGTDRASYREVFEGAHYTRLHHRLPSRLAARGTTKFDTFGAVAWPSLVRNRFDVVHSLSATGAVAARLAGQRTIYTPLGFPTEDQFRRRPLDREMFAAGVRAAHVTTALSQAAARQIAALLGSEAEPLSPGLRTRQFPPNLEPRTGPPRVLFSAFAADRRKGVEYLLRAAPTVLDRHPDARFLLMGGGDHEWAFAELGADEDRVRAAVDADHAPDIGPYYREATVLALPSQHEAFGLVLVEALSSGTPVVCSDDGGMPEIVSCPEVGRLAPFGDVTALSRALLDAIELARRPETPGRCADHALQWDWSVGAGPAHERLYERVSSRHRRVGGGDCHTGPPRSWGVATRARLGGQMTEQPTPSDLVNAIRQRDWYHTIELAPGVVTPGWFDLRSVALRLPWPDLAGARCLDVGTFDGFWAFEMERRGASEVVAIDILDPRQWDWPAGTKQETIDAIGHRKGRGEGFDIARDALGSAVQRRELNVYDLDPADLGQFDVVYLGSILLHLRDPIRALERVRSVCRGTLISVDTIDVPLTIAHPIQPVARLDGVGRPWWWQANRSAIRRMIEVAGFEVDTELRVLMPAGAGQPRPPLRLGALRHAAGRTAMMTSWIGDPHLATLAH